LRESEPESLARKVIELCADCDQCRDFMEDTPCLFFTELYRLHDKEKELGSPASSADLSKLLDLCNMCGLCSCPNVRADIRRAKDAFIARDGLSPAIRILEDVQLVGKLCGAYPRLANLLAQNGPVGGVLKTLAGIHPERKLPRFPPEGFDPWARRRGLHRKRAGTGRKVAYFAGCTARYLFPEVAKAAVEVLERSGVEVYFPEQKCCGMPSLLEGDRAFTFSVAGFNLQRLADVVQDGYDVVCSCPTCGYVLKNMFSEGAYFSESYRAALKSEAPGAPAGGSGASGADLPDAARAGGAPGRSRSPSPKARTLASLLKGESKGSYFGFTQELVRGGYLKDESYFAPLDGAKRISISSHTYDLGEYLQELDRSGELNRKLGPVTDRVAYYPPCHLKEQNIGQPWWELLGLVPDLPMEKVGGVFDCCGIAGIMGFKREFHETSIAMGKRLMDKIKAADPERVACDCLSCRIQFDQTLPYEVCHPVEILKESYEGYRG
jgi:glycerol-3-phosphate dehydrogenase subunit C